MDGLFAALGERDFKTPGIELSQAEWVEKLEMIVLG